MAQSPLMLVVVVLVLATAVVIFTLVQITNTEQSVFGLLQIGTQLTPGATGAQVRDMINGNLGYYNGIAAVIGWGVQIALLLVSVPPDSALLSMHRRFNTDASPSLTEAALSQEKWRQGLTYFLVGGDILTDFLYVLNGHIVVIGWNGILPQFASGVFGVILVGILFPACICFVTIFGFKYTLVYLEALIDKITNR
jgi:hypothetical protein